MSTFLIINADDFGACGNTNEAVVRAHREGVLTSASLMVNERGTSEAVALVRENPSLAVGLHLVLSDGNSALPADRIPTLVDSASRFRPSPALAGIRIFFSAGARKQARLETAEQFRRFVATGLPFSHVDGHQHLHVHPVIWDETVRLAVEHGVRGIRIPNDELVAAPFGRRIEQAFFRALRRRCLRTLRGKNLLVADHVYGHLATGNLNEVYLVKLLGRLGGCVNEIYLHPGTPHATPLPGSPGMDVELHALLSSEVRQRIEELGIVLTSYISVPTP